MPSVEIIEIILPPLAVGVMVSLIHAPMGIEVLRRGIVFIDLAIAQIAGLAVVLVNTWLHEPNWGTIQMFAVAAAIVAAFLFRWVELKLPREQEATIGSCFILAASLSLMVLADHPHGGEEIQHILSGQILFMTWSTFLSFLPIYLVAIGLWYALPRTRTGLPFFLIFAIVVTASVQLVGVYVVFASLILPALAVNCMTSRKDRKAIACGVGAIMAGIVLSVAIDQPAGPMIVVTLALTTVIVRTFQSRETV
jgi:zinc/manganese transport system permease protein